MFKAIFTATLLCIPCTTFAETLLLMAERDGCYWCDRWDVEIAAIYPKTSEGKTARLERFDIKTGARDVDLEKPVRFTPTFILVNDGKEVGRIEGYPGEDFFWAMLSMMIKDADIPFEQAS